MFTDNIIIGAGAIFLVRVLSITISTIRVLIMGRQSGLIVAGLAFIEALSFALTFGSVAANLANVWNLIAYSLGFSVGTWVGMLLEERLIKGYATVNIVSMNRSLPIVDAIRKAGFGATRTAGEGASGTVGLVRAVVNRRDAPRIVALVENIDSKAFVTVEETRRISRGFVGYGRS